MRYGEWLRPLSAIIIVLLCSACNAAASTAEVRCYTATGHTIRGDFLRTYDALGGLHSLGYPITEPFVQEGRMVQYFEYARLEDHPDNPDGPVVKLSMLGERLGRRHPLLDARAVPPSGTPSVRYYPETGHSLSGAFLDFFDRHGGLRRFGFPINEPMLVDGQLVQDFQHIRLIWHARAPEGHSVTMEKSGYVYFTAQKLDAQWLQPQPCPVGAQIVPLVKTDDTD
ncbi:MAG: hypothetical protein DDG58_12185 [Ardenticatenia bacterium]|nr:MAG: hypothetical protein DDG58_12185 [Ardenticatenia bacterium]